MTPEHMIIYGTSVCLLLLKKPLFAVVWILGALFYIPSADLAIASIAMFGVVIVNTLFKVV